MRATDRGRDEDINALTGAIIGCAITVHRYLGPGLLETAYQECMAAELRHAGLSYRRQVQVPIVYRDVRVEHAYRIDLLVEEHVIVELKVADGIAPVHVSQVLTYLRLYNLQVGLLFNFNVDALVQGGIKRVVRGHGILRPSESPGRSEPPASIR